MPAMATQWMMTAPAAALTRRDIPLPEPAADEVLVAIAGCGVCHTDLGYLYDGVRTNHPLPLTLGHEISGRVVAAGAGEAQWLGRSVIVPAVLPCGVCDLCRRGLATICRGQKMPGNDIDGGFATHIRVPGRGLCAVDPARLEAAGLTLADVSVVADAVTTPYQAVRRAGVGPGEPRDRDRHRRRRRLRGADRPCLRRRGGGDRYRRRQAGADRPSRRRAHAERARDGRAGAEGGDRGIRRPPTVCAGPSGSSSNVPAPPPARPPPGRCWSPARRCRWSASRWTGSSSACPT